MTAEGEGTGMFEARDGYEYLETLRAQNGKQVQSFQDFSEYLEAKARKQGIPIHGQLELTPLCNLNCRMCYVRLNPEQLGERRILTVAQWKDLIRQAFDAGMFQATLTGGECLSYPGFEEVYLYLHSLGCEVDVMTNASLLDESRIRFFQKHPPAMIQVTLYGENEDVYERVTGRRVFRTVLENLRSVKEAGFPLIISITPNQALGEDVFETIRLAASLTQNVFINTSLFVPEGEAWRTGASDDPGAAFYARILRFHKELQGSEVQEYPEQDLPAPGGPCRECWEKGVKCGGGRSGFLINWKGELRMCNRFGPSSFPLRDGFPEAWKQIHETAMNWPRAKECRDCAYETVCSNCPADALKYAEPGKLPSGLCERTRYMVSRGVLPFAHCNPKEAMI